MRLLLRPRLLTPFYHPLRSHCRRPMATKVEIPPSERRIVSSFLLLNLAHPSPLRPSQPSTYRILLFKRSSSVRVYKNLWAACSGSIDPTIDSSPRAAAVREIREETGLNLEDCPPLSGGTEDGVIEIDDQDVGVKWKIYPFLWELPGGGSEEEWMRRVRLDWEHTECRFVGVEEVEGMETVRHLGRSLRRALEGMGDSDIGGKGKKESGS